MDEPISNLVIITVGNFAVFLLIFLSRFVVRIGKDGEFGLYMILLPISFNCLGGSIPIWFMATSVLIGLGSLLWGFRKRLKVGETF